MIYEKIDNLIATTIKVKARAGSPEESSRIGMVLEVYRAIKTEFVTLGYNTTHIPTEEQEIAVLKGMVTKRRKAADEYLKAGEKQRASAETEEINIIMGLLPESAKGPSVEAVVEETMCVIKNFINLKALSDGGFDGNLMRYTKDIIAKVKEKYPEAENGIIAGIVKTYK